MKNLLIVFSILISFTSTQVYAQKTDEQLIETSKKYVTKVLQLSHLNTCESAAAKIAPYMAVGGVDNPHPADVGKQYDRDLMIKNCKYLKAINVNTFKILKSEKKFLKDDKKKKTYTFYSVSVLQNGKSASFLFILTNDSLLLIDAGYSKT